MRYCHRESFSLIREELQQCRFMVKIKALTDIVPDFTVSTVQVSHNQV
uniref:Uncharacterized protein n=1 Tax=Anguilla anguilla TaxID=7936 RepID=A0A0E9X7K8_ANGAN